MFCIFSQPADIEKELKVHSYIFEPFFYDTQLGILIILEIYIQLYRCLE